MSDLDQTCDELSDVLTDIWNTAKDAPAGALRDIMGTLEDIAGYADAGQALLGQIQEEIPQ